MILIGAAFNVLDGLVAISNASYYSAVAATHNIQLPVTNTIHDWGWAALIFGIALLLPGFGVFTGATWARALGVGLVGLNMVFRMAFLAAFPFWSFTMLLVDALIIYGLIVHGGRHERRA